MVRLITVGSSSAGNSYALDTGSEILLLEAGIKMADVKRAIGYRLADVVGCVSTHRHGDHSKYITEYAKFGVNCYGPQDIADHKQFPYGKFTALKAEKTYHIGSFDVVPFDNYHDVPIYGYLIRHKEMGGTMLFSTDSYKISMTLRGVNHFLIEANYSDDIIKENFRSGLIDKHQVDRIMLSHMSLDYCIQYLRDCEADKSRTITLCHLSERNSDAELFRQTVAGAFGVPAFIASKGTIVELNKEEL